MNRPPLLIVGLSGQLGDAVRRIGLPCEAEALTRRPPPTAADDAAGVRWRQGDLGTFASSGPYDVLLSLGPLDGLAAAVRDGRLRAGRIVAFGSTSVHVKTTSPDPAERDVARRLAEAEAMLGGVCRRSGIPLFLFRPTLVWGMGRDATLSRIAGLARRWPVLPLPVDAPGLRQPVHALDLATAALAALATDARLAGAYDLPGGERLAFGEMVRRTVPAAAPGCRIVPLPARLVGALAVVRPALRGLASRLHQDLVFDDRPAREALGWNPRGFRPDAGDFPS